MEKYLFIAEKPSLMRDVQACYENHKKEVQSHVGRIDFIALTGHVCTNFEPNDYEGWDQKWGMVTYPMIPDFWGIKVIDDDSKKKTVEEIRSRASDYDGLICGTDSDVEGYGIFYNLATYLGLQTKKTLRFMEHSLTDVEILKSLLSMTDYHKDPVHQRAIKSFLLRSRADWLFGMNSTRLMSVKLDLLMTIGRVKAPTIKLVYDNSVAIERFNQTTYYVIQAVYDTGVERFISTLADDKLKPVVYAGEEEAKTAAMNIPGRGVVDTVDRQAVETSAPRLYDLTSLQTEAGQWFGYTPTQTLSLVQSLYETHKLISYPRTQCRFISSERAKEIPQMLQKVSVFPDLEKYLLTINPERISEVLAGSAIVNDDEVMAESHDALLPTDKRAVLSDLSPEETNILRLIYMRLLAQFLPKLKEQKIRVRILHGDKPFYSMGKSVLDYGWRILYGKPKEMLLPSLEKGQVLTGVISPVKKKTSPPKRLTQATLIAAMKNIANLVPDKELRASLADSQGIGTPATRDRIISDIIGHGYVRDVKKKAKGQTEAPGLYITSLGRTYIENLAGIKIVSPVFAAVMDMNIKKIQRGEADYETVYKDVIDDLYALCDQIRNLEVKEVVSPYTCKKCGQPLYDRRSSYDCSNKDCDFKIKKKISGKFLSDAVLRTLFDGKTTDEMTFKKKDGSEFSARLILTDKGVEFTHGSGYVCPFCGGAVRENKGGWFCDCGLKIFRKTFGRDLSAKEAEELIKKGFLSKRDGFVSKSGSEYEAALILDKTEKRVKLSF